MEVQYVGQRLELIRQGVLSQSITQ